MKAAARKVRRFLLSSDGPTAVEYAVVLVLIAAVCIAAVVPIGDWASAAFRHMSTM